MSDDGEAVLGHGVTAAWVQDRSGRIVGIIETHMHQPHDDDGGPVGDPYPYSGSVPVHPELYPESPHWTVTAGTLGEWAGLTLEPSIACRSCSNHGWIRDGTWVPA